MEEMEYNTSENHASSGLSEAGLSTCCPAALRAQQICHLHDKSNKFLRQQFALSQANFAKLLDHLKDCGHVDQEPSKLAETMRMEIAQQSAKLQEAAQKQKRRNVEYQMKINQKDATIDDQNEKIAALEETNTRNNFELIRMASDIDALQTKNQDLEELVLQRFGVIDPPPGENNFQNSKREASYGSLFADSMLPLSAVGGNDSKDLSEDSMDVKIDSTAHLQDM